MPGARMIWQRKPHSDRRGPRVLTLLAAVLLPALAGAQLPVLQGRLVSADSALPIPDGTRVLVDWGGLVDTVNVDTTGRFAGMLRQSFGDSASLTIVAGDEFYPARLRIFGASPGAVDVVMVPRRWAIRAGSYAGDTVAISPDAALDAVDGTFARVASARAAPLRGLVAWPRERIPVPLAIHRTRDDDVDPPDSVALWRTIDALERELGATLFRPADDSAVQAEGWGIEVRVDRGIAGSGLTNLTWSNGGRLFDASISVRHAADFGAPGIMHHELLHALGFGHTSAWRSVMTRTVTAEASTLTREDVAYTQLLLRVGELQRALGTRYGIVAAAEGERWSARAPGYRLSKSTRSSVQPSTW